MAGPKQLVTAPAFDPRNFGLLSVVEARYDVPDAHWQNGVIWQDLCGLGGSTYDPFCLASGTGNTPADKAENVDWNTYGATPFTVFAETDCSPVGYSREEHIARGAEALSRTEAYQVERAFWTGTVGGDADKVYPRLAASASVTDSTLLPVVNLQCAATTVTGSTVLDVTEGLGRLEAAFHALYGGKGVVHVPVALAEALFSWHLIEADGGVLRTRLGNKVAVGAGYPGTSSAGVAPAAGTTWAYMTPPIFAYRSSQFSFRFVEQFNRENNLFQGITERTYVLGYSCCALVGVLMSLGGDVTGQPNSAF